ncbi:DUF3103 domain-containing protein [Kitasatospora purpeofusca]|uniref:DUF3103 family protein n=1 Tax=Kitasatospora purpeofusca TaxID=67352 RepID=UPI002258A4C3|nr:DUF3103 family protein [Kitasatospora purpeofusca]MCX4684997.1 DUF3103 domain-containing protein [Kitasatospora purpeofusca]
MSQSRLRRAVVALTALPLLALGAGQAVAAPAPTPAPVASKVTAIEDEVARTLAASLADPALRERLRSATAAAPAGAELAPLAAGLPGATAHGLAATTTRADRAVATAKGLGDLGPLLRVQLADPSMRAALDAGAAPLVATAGTDEHARTVRAYDTAGRAHTLDARTLPTRPVYLVDLDTAKALAAGIDLLQRELAARGVGPAGSSAPTAQAAAGWWGTKITSVEVNDDEEPWFKGAAEMFSLVSGFGPDGKVRVESVAMPYLQYDGTVYYPNQILVNWSNYKYNLADVVLMEDDGDTNYLALAQAVAAVLLTIADQGAYIPLVNAVLAALPTSWWTDDPDYVESWYTLARTSTGRLNGARGNGWMTVEPYWVSQL